VFVLTFLLASSAFAQTQPTDVNAGGGGAPPPPTTVGGPGESCRARADCKAGLKCMNQMCTDQHEGETCGATSDCGGELKCIGQKCTSPFGAAHGGAGGGGDMTEWMKFNVTDGSPHPFVGVTFAGGFDTLGITGNIISGGFNTFDGSFLFALNGGVVIGNHQLSFEAAPFTYIYDGKAQGPAFEMNASYAYLIPLGDSGNAHFYWPIRFGAGMMAGGNNTGGLVFFQLRADLIGVAIQVGHVIIDLHLPTFRYAITDRGGSQAHYLDWMFGTSIGYAF
jgi:hypothetical protein